MKIGIVMRKSFVVNTALVVVKLIAGIFFRSTALIADGIHSLSDLLSDIFVIFGIRQGLKPPDKEHPFGHGKVEYVLSFLLGISILFVAYQLIQSVIVNFAEPIVIPSPLGIVVVIIVIIVKFSLSRYLLSRGRLYESQVIIASGKESFTDVISSVVVLIGIVLAVIGDATQTTWLMYGDRVAGILIGALIIRIALQIIIDAIKSLLGQSVKESVLNDTRKIAEQVKGVIKVDHLDMIVFGHYYQAMIDIRVDGDITVKAGHDIANDVKDTLKNNDKIAHVIVHVNPEE